MRNRRVKMTALQSVMHQHKQIYDQEVAAQRSARAGWFYDPQKQSTYRYWTGSRWTEHTSDELRFDHPPVEDPPAKPTIWRKLKALLGRE